jgi:ribonuclease J
MQLIIHRGAHQVGGSCVELSHGNFTILLDIGLPLDSGFNDNPESHLPQPLFDEIQQGTKKIDGVLLSHAHMDHYGLVGMLPQDIPVYCGYASADLMDLTSRISLQNMQPVSPHFFKNGEPFSIGPFSITPYLMDHSAFDSYAFLISAGGKSLFYTGDFRAHGRKANTFDHLINNPPYVDVLLMEGTMVGSRSDEAACTEEKLEEQFVQLIAETPGIVLVSASSQNIDRLVTLFRSTIRSQRFFIIDFYTAEIIERLGKYANIPQPSWSKIRVCYPKRLGNWFERLGLRDIPEKHRKNGIRWTKLREIEDKVVLLVRPNFLDDIKKFLSLEGATWIYSMWPGYLEREGSLKELRTYFQEKGVRFESLHTGGHAGILDLKKMAEAMKPSTVIPIHSFHPEKFMDEFSNVTIVKDGETFPFV